MTKIPNIGWLFQKNYYQHQLDNGTQQFFTRYFDDLKDKISEENIEVEGLKNQKKRETSDHKKAEINEKIKQLEGSIATKNKAIANFFRQKNKHITSLKWRGYADHVLACAAATGDPLKLTIGYPGFVTGTGLQRGMKELEGEIKIGFAFDHTTGLPYLPASSLKGVLRSAFPQRNNDELQKNHPTYAASRQRFLEHYFKTAQIDLPDRAAQWLKARQIDFPTLDLRTAIDLLERSIFHHDIPQCFDASGKPDYVPMRPSQRDVFFDAFLESDDMDQPFMATDFITPHINREKGKAYLSPFIEPTPLEFLKVRPGMRFCFQWALQDGILTATEKRDLFEHLLLASGIGAKTRVGYGQLES